MGFVMWNQLFAIVIPISMEIVVASVDLSAIREQ